AGVVVLVSPAEPDPSLKQILETASAARGLQFVIVNEIAPETAVENLAMVVSKGDFPTLGQMADQLPDVEFVVIGQSVVEPKENLTILEEGSELRLAQAFLAGYIGAVQSEEYRVGIISVNDAAGMEFRQAFLNGVIYFCGNCVPIYPPYVVYPQYREVDPAADRDALENAARVLISEGVTIMLAAPELQNPDLFNFLAQNGVRLLGTEPPPAGLEGNWVASVILTSETGVEESLLALLDGNPVPETVENIEINYFGGGEARLKHFDQILKRLVSGEIDPLGAVD
ncbi:MAG: hypothetical protein JW757_00015, partial [Anaerolineales bacterium]|nr:hypothetical protein [Anaerolineales bacterium]